ncbi:MAG: hypothetical protein Q8R42_00315, partial [Desulfocapsaceae bacterium]|nr:hypothetical protein [Desulfocapsaceae bacterium]
MGGIRQHQDFKGRKEIRRRQTKMESHAIGGILQVSIQMLERPKMSNEQMANRAGAAPIESITAYRQDINDGV